MKIEQKNEATVSTFRINDDCIGFSEYNAETQCWNFSITSIDASKSALENNYIAGYIQGKLQGRKMIENARNNSWKNAYLVDTGHAFPKQLPPSTKELQKTCENLTTNYGCLINWIKNSSNPKTSNILRLLYRMIGIFDGATDKEAMTGTQLEARVLGSSSSEQMTLGYGTTPLSFMDVYFINAQLDLFDIISTSPESCTAFLKRTDDDIYWTHNSWCGFLAMSHTMTYLILNDNKATDAKNRVDFLTQNCYCPGQFGSNMDFGFNGHGICFNETTHRYSKNESKVDGLWLCWRAAAAEAFSQNIADFYDYITLDNTGTYLNGYVIIDAHSKETALIEMSYTRFVLFSAKSTDNEYKIYEECGGKEVLIDRNRYKDYYNPDLLCKEYIFGVNYPTSYNVSNDLLSRDNRPKRRIQLKERIKTVIDMESAKNLITYVEPGEPLSIYGRWDLDCGNAGGYSKKIPDGAIDAKAFSANSVTELLKTLQFLPDSKSTKTSFWMKYGAPEMDGKPFIWSESEWKDYRQADDILVPDELTGKWHEVKLFIK